jgi:hypothetical protein
MTNDVLNYEKFCKMVMDLSLFLELGESTTFI